MIDQEREELDSQRRKIVEERLRLRDLDCEAIVGNWMGSSAVLHCHKPATWVAHSFTGAGRPVFPVVCDEHAAVYKERGGASQFTPIKEAEKISLYGTGSANGHLQWDWKIKDADRKP